MGLLSRLPWNCSARPVRAPSSATRLTRRPSCSAASTLPLAIQGGPLDMVARVGRQLPGPPGSRRHRAMRLFGMSLKSSSPPRHTGPSVKPSPPAMRSMERRGRRGRAGPGRALRAVSRVSWLRCYQGLTVSAGALRPPRPRARPGGGLLAAFWRRARPDQYRLGLALCSSRDPFQCPVARFQYAARSGRAQGQRWMHRSSP